MFEFCVGGNVLYVQRKEELVSGSRKIYHCCFQFDGLWDGLDKTVVFRAGSVSIRLLPDAQNHCVIPWEVLAEPGKVLYVGIVGTSGDEIRRPTVETRIDYILPGTGGGVDGQEPSADVYAQILQRATSAEQIARSVRDDADAGAFQGPPGDTYTLTEADKREIAGMVDTSDVNVDLSGYATIAYVDDAVGAISLTPGPKGPKGDKGDKGEAGYTPVKGVDYFDGENGHTPVAGMDYFTAADKAEMVQAVLAEIPTTEEQWTFELEDGSTVTKKVAVYG